MSNAKLLQLPIKLKYDFSNSPKLLNEIIDILELFDHLYMADLNSLWIAIRQDKLEEFLSHGRTNPALLDLEKVIARLSEEHAKAQSVG